MKEEMVDHLCKMAEAGLVEATPRIVRCKDCKYWEVDTDVGFCVRTEDCDWTADDFCSRGEKKDE